MINSCLVIRLNRDLVYVTWPDLIIPKFFEIARWSKIRVQPSIPAIFGKEKAYPRVSEN